MSEILCWNCNKEHGVEEGEIAHCQHCFVDIDRVPYKPITSEPYKEEEEEMPFDKQSQDWLRLPKVGQSYDYSPHGAITEIKKVEGEKGFHFTSKEKVVLPDGSEATVDKDLGYRYDVIFTDGKKMSISDWSSYYALTRADVQEGDTISINHPLKGVWEITKL